MQARAGDDTPRSPIPEPIFSETVTDIDGTENGELELSADGGGVRSRQGGGQLQLAGIEAEWLATSHLGLRLEPGIVRTAGPGTAPRTDVGVGTTASWKLVTDLPNDFYLQAEVGADWPPGSDRSPSPDQPGLPFAFDMRAAFRRGLWTFRGSLGTGVGGSSAYAPVRASLAVLVSFERSSRTGYFGLETLADGTWLSPVFAAPNLVADLSPLGLPVRFGVAVPWSPGAGATQPSLGIYFRLIVEPLRDLRHD